MRPLPAGLLVLAASFLALAAHADTLDLFTLTGGGNTSTWTLPSPINFTYHNEPQFVPTFPITLTTNGVSTNSSVTFEYGHVANLIVGGLQIINFPSVLNATQLSNDGTVSTYTGTFDTGSFSGGVETFGTGGLTYVPYTLTIAPQQQTNPTPEPSTWVLLATALFAFFSFARRLQSSRTPAQLLVQQQQKVHP